MLELLRASPTFFPLMPTETSMYWRNMALTMLLISNPPDKSGDMSKGFAAAVFFSVDTE